jgi:hypothetical protein
MSLPNIFNGMLGSSEVQTLSQIPSAQFQTEIFGNRNPRPYKSEPIAPKILTPNIDVSTRRTVLPCKGITHQVLRREAVPAAGGMIAPTGTGRHQPKGLSQERPTNGPIMPFSNPFNSAMNNPLKAPA